MAGLGHVSLVDAVGVRAVIRGQFVGEAGPRGVVSSFNGGKPGGLDWVPSSGMEEFDECRCAGEVVGPLGGFGRGRVAVGDNRCQGWWRGAGQVEAPQFGACPLPVSGEDGSVVGIEDCDRGLVEVCRALGGIVACQC